MDGRETVRNDWEISQDGGPLSVYTVFALGANTDPYFCEQLVAIILGWTWPLEEE